MHAASLEHGLGRDAILASLKRKGFEARDDRDYIVLTFAGLTRSIYTKLSRGSKYKVYGNPLLGDVCKQLRLTRKQLDQLIECPMDRGQYLEALRAHGIGLKPSPKVAPKKPGK
ncbi:MAG: hypothetical protein ACREOF_15875 [Gemmatimonadales bacterium]